MTWSLMSVLTLPPTSHASIDWAVYKHAMEGVTVDLSTNKGTGGDAMGDTLVEYRIDLGFRTCRYLHCRQTEAT